MAASMVDAINNTTSEALDKVIPTIEMPYETLNRRRCRLSWSQTPGMPPAPDQDSSDPETPLDSPPATSITHISIQKTSPRKKRIVLNAADHLVLMRLCGEHRQDYQHSNIMKFWELIADLFETDTGKLTSIINTHYSLYL